MKQPILISLLLLHLLGNTELCQLVSIPKIFDHYRIHRTWNPKSSFMEFIGMHYIGSDGIDGDDQADRDLPFMHFYHPNSLVATAPPTVCSSEPAQYDAGFQNSKSLNNDHVMPAHAGALLRPPRMVA